MIQFSRFLLVFMVSVTALAEGDHGAEAGRVANPEWSLGNCFRLNGGKAVADNPTITKTITPAKGIFSSGTFNFDIQFGDGKYSVKGPHRATPEVQKNGDRRFFVATENSVFGKHVSKNTTYVEKPGGEKTVAFISQEIVRNKDNQSRRVKIIKVSSTGALVEAEITYVKNAAADLRITRTCGNAFGFNWPGNPNHYQPTLVGNPGPLPAGLESVAYGLHGTSSVRRRILGQEARLLHHLFDLEVAARSR